MFVALEILSLPLYLLCGLARRRRLLSQEAALKYFLLGALSSAFFLYGTALLYGYSGSFLLSGIDDAIRNGVNGTGPQGTGLLLAGMGLLAVGLLFKFGAVPFHSWTPDVYTGAPDAGDRVHGVLHQDRGDRRPDAGLLRGARRGPLGLAAADGRRRRGHDGRGIDPGDHPDRREADAGLQLDRARGLHPDGRRRGLPGRHRGPRGVADQRLVGDVLPRRVRGGHHRRLRARDHGARLHGGGDPAVELGGPRASARRWPRWSSRCSCSASPGSRSPAASSASGPSSRRPGAVARTGSSSWPWSSASSPPSSTSG